MDIVGPLPRSSSRKRFILVICDYATRYPEAVALRTMDANTIAEELVQFFAWVGIPEEILTDQGTNFNSQLLAEVCQLLHIKPIRTTPYHPQTDGLVERFNHTLKSMLWKTAAEGKDWDRLLPYLLGRHLQPPPGSHLLSSYIATMSGDLWMSSRKRGRRVQRALRVLCHTYSTCRNG